MKYPIIALGIASLIWLSLGENEVFSDNLSALNPLPPNATDLDTQLRHELGAPDVRRLVLIEGKSSEEVLLRSERVSERLDELVERGIVESFEAPTRYLPSVEAQKRRQADLPSDDRLQTALAAALRGMPVAPHALDPFVKDVAAAKQGAPLLPDDLLAQPLLGQGLGTLLSKEDDGAWLGLVLLSGVAQPEQVEQAIGELGDAQIHYVDLQKETMSVISSYRIEALWWLAGGLGLASLVLFALLSVRRALQSIVSLLVSIAITAAILTLCKTPLTPFHLASLLLVAGLSLDYALFMSRDQADTDELRCTLKSLIVCALTTLSGFALMALSSAPILRGIGLTVAIGVTISLFAAFAICGSRAKAGGDWNRLA
jgi:predicted exporter